jgi:hypothetical protein
MADTYVEVSSKYIIPGVNKVDRLSLNSDVELSESALQNKISAVEHYSRDAQKKVSALAREVSSSLYFRFKNVPYKMPAKTTNLERASGGSGRGGRS